MFEKGTEQDYKTIRDLGTKLHIPTPEMFWAFKVEDISTEEVIHEHEERGHSWVRNSYNALASQFCGVNCNDGSFGDGKINWISTSGKLMYSTSPLTLQYNSPETVGYGFLGAIGSNQIGVVVGIGTAPYHFDQWRLSNIVQNGNSAGQLSHTQSDNPVKTWDSSGRTYTVTFVRVFNNNSPSQLTINEVGIYCTPQSSQYAMAVRDVLATPVTIPASSKLTVTYSMVVTFPNTTSGNTIHLNHFESTFDDEQGKQWAVSNSWLVLSNAQSKFGTKSFTITNNGYVYYPPSADFDFGTGDFTLEIFFWMVNTGNLSIFGATEQYTPIHFSASSGKSYLYISSNGTSWNIANSVQGTQNISANAWHHGAICRSGNNLNVFIDGKVDKTFDVTGQSFNFGFNKFCLGVNYPSNYGVGCYYDEFRASRIARYTSTFAVPTGPFTLD